MSDEFAGREAPRLTAQVAHLPRRSARAPAASSPAEPSPRSMSARADNRSRICRSASACRPKTDSPSPSEPVQQPKRAGAVPIARAPCPARTRTSWRWSRRPASTSASVDLGSRARRTRRSCPTSTDEPLQITADGAHQVFGAFERYTLARAREHLLDRTRELAGLGRLSLDHAAELVDDLEEPRVLRELLGDQRQDGRRRRVLGIPHERFRVVLGHLVDPAHDDEAAL